MLLLSKDVQKGESEVSFDFKFPPLGQESNPGSISLDTFYLTAESEDGTMTLSIETDSLVLTTTSQNNFLKMAVVAICRLTESKLKRLESKKYWSKSPIFKLQEEGETRGVLGQIYLAPPAGTYLYSSKYELLALLGFDSTDIHNVDELGMEELGGGFFVTNNSRSPRPSSRPTPDAVPTNQIKLGLRGDEMSWNLKAPGAPDNLGKDLVSPVTFGFIRPGSDTYGRVIYDVELNPEKSLTEFANEMNKFITRFMLDHNLVSGPRFTNVEGIMELYAGPGKENYELNINLSDNLSSFLKITDPMTVRSEIKIKTLIVRGGRAESSGGFSLVSKQNYPVSVHSRTAVMNSYMTEFGLIPCIALLTKNHSVLNAGSVTFSSKGGEKTVSLHFLDKNHNLVSFSSAMTVHAVFTHV